MFLQDEMRHYFDDFVEAFISFDGAVIARRYQAPYLAVRADGSSVCFLSAADIARYFQGIVDGYRQQGCCACRYRDLQVVPMGGAAAMATVTWELLRDGGHILSEWRESYSLVRVREQWVAVASVDHVNANF